MVGWLRLEKERKEKKWTFTQMAVAVAADNKINRA
jgi:hypothetical protein